MNIILLIAYIILNLSFLYRLGAGIFVLWNLSLEDIQSQVTSIKSKSVYWWGVGENALYILCVQLLYWV